MEYSIANLCSVIVNIARSAWGKKNAKMTSPIDFMPCWDIEEAKKIKVPKKQSIEEMKQILLSLGKSKKR